MQETITYKYCLRCHRPLKTEEAKRLGYGKICYEKSRTALSNKKRLIVPVAKSRNM